MGIRIDGEDGAELGSAASPDVRQVESLVRAVQLEGGAGPCGLGEDGLPIEVEVVAAADVAPGGVGDDVDVWARDSGQGAGRQLLARLAARDVNGGHDQVVASQKLIRIVERGVGADLELAAVEQPEALGRGFGRSRSVGLFALEALVEGYHDPPLSLHAFQVKASGDRQAHRVVGQGQVGVAAPPRVEGHLLD